MQAVILAGGLGTRLRPLTHTVPKVLVAVAGRPFIDWIIDRLTRDVFDEVLLLTGHLGDQVRDHCGDGSQYGLRMRYSQEPEPLGTAGALRFAADLLDERFVLLNGDTYLELDYPCLLAAHERGERIGTMVIAQPHDPQVRPNLRVEPDGRIAVYAKATVRPDLNAVDAGVALLDRRVLHSIPTTYPSGLEQQVYASLCSAGELFGYVAGATYCDVGTPTGLQAMEAALSTAKAGPSGETL